MDINEDAYLKELGERIAQELNLSMKELFDF